MTYEEARDMLFADGAKELGDTLLRALNDRPAIVDLDFTPTPGKPQPHFRAIGPRGGTTYMRHDHHGHNKIVYGSDD